MASNAGAFKQAELICSVYREVSSNNNSKVFENKFLECMSRRTSKASIEEYEDRQKGIDKLFEDKTVIVQELTRQAKQYMCSEVREELEKCNAHGGNTRECATLEAAFDRCVSRCVSDKSVAEYQAAGRKGTENVFVKRERNFEMAQATRLLFSFGV